jgi:tRNA (guanine37-N1)-methyltransferase
MRFDLVTIFPDFFRGPLDHGILRRAQDSGLVEVRVHDLRQFTQDRHRTVDDRPFGGGEGMVLKPEPLFEAVESLLGVGGVPPVPNPQPAQSQPTAGEGSRVPIVLLSASGKLFRQADARRFAALDRIILLCGRYEGVDERVAEHLATDELSIGDFVLSGGELPAALIVDAVTRLLPGALGNQDSAANESFSGSGELPFATSAEVVGRPLSAFRQPLTPSPQPLAPGPGLLDCPHYTRPADFRGWRVPDVLISGNHADVRRWRRKMALAKTLRNRPELIAGAHLSDEARALLTELQTESESTDSHG